MKRFGILFLLICRCVCAGEAAPGQSGKSFADPIDREVDESSPAHRFVIVPGKDPSGWSFTLEPYLWATGMAGKIGVKGEPPSSIDYSARTVLQHLDWGIFAKGEVRKDKWGLLADGFFAQLSASGSQPGGLYKDIDVTVQQGMASLALAYRVLEDRAWFVDVYAGARYNYLGIDVTGSLDDSAIQQLGDTVVERVSSEARSRLEDIVREELARRGENRSPILPDRAANALRDALAARMKAKAAPEIAKAEAAIASAKKKLSKAITEALEDELSTGDSGAQWWVDPIVGLRAQVNLTRWLFLAAQGDVGGFYAGSRIAWNVQATVGVNFTRNVYAEIGYRYFYMDYNRDGAVYDAAEFGLFSGIGVKF
jgi:hypothetical protein